MSIYSKWINYTLSLFIGIISLITLFNYLMDPLWCFNHHFSFQNHQEAFNERQQKINLIKFNSFNYNALLLGSSRVTVHNVSLNPVKTFNLAINGMKQNEFNGYIQYAKQRNNKAFEYIILGLDLTAIQNSDPINTADFYLKTSSTPFYRYKTLLSYDTFTVSMKNFRNSAFNKYKKRFKTYNQDHIAITSSKNSNQVIEIISQSLKKPTLKLSYNRDAYLSLLKQLKQNNPSSKFIVFTTPLPAPLLKNILQNKDNKAIYDLWLQDLVKEFGHIYHFCYINEITEGYPTTFVDEGHYTSEIGNIIDQKIMGKKIMNSKYKNFGILLDQKNIINFIHYKKEYHAI